MKPKTNTARRGIYIPEPMHKQILRLARKEGVTVSEWIRNACREKLEKV